MTLNAVPPPLAPLLPVVPYNVPLSLIKAANGEAPPELYGSNESVDHPFGTSSGHAKYGSSTLATVSVRPTLLFRTTCHSRLRGSQEASSRRCKQRSCEAPSLFHLN